MLLMFCGLCVSVGHNHDLWWNSWTNQDSRCRVQCGVGWLKELYIRWGPEPSREKGQFWGTCHLLRSIGNIRREPKLLGRWQQWCGCLLPVQQQLVFSIYITKFGQSSLHIHCCSGWVVLVKWLLVFLLVSKASEIWIVVWPCIMLSSFWQCIAIRILSIWKQPMVHQLPISEKYLR